MGVSTGLRFRVLKRDNYRCNICGKRALEHNDVELEVDHIYPQSKGGGDHIGNLWTLCKECNRGKTDIVDLQLISPDSRIFRGVKPMESEKKNWVLSCDECGYSYGQRYLVKNESCPSCGSSQQTIFEPAAHLEDQLLSIQTQNYLKAKKAARVNVKGKEFSYGVAFELMELGYRVSYSGFPSSYFEFIGDSLFCFADGDIESWGKYKEKESFYPSYQIFNYHAWSVYKDGQYENPIKLKVYEA